MTLRLRLVLALLVLLVAGLTLFGVATYSFYARSQYQRLDDQVRAAVPLASARLHFDADHTEPAGGDVGPGGGRGRPPAAAPLGTYAELRDANGAVLQALPLATGTATPKLPDELPDLGRNGRLFTVGAENGSGRFRVLATPDRGPGDEVIVVAVPTTEISNALHRLFLTETFGGAALLIALLTGSWFILRRGLHPLEEMASDARSISAGDLSQRVSPSGGPTEVGQLGLALNTMLGDIEGAFRERAATEQKLRQFLADASHELRTPLTSIQGFAELFRLGGEDERLDLPTIMRRIEQESARMKGLVEDLLLLARLDETRPVERRPVDLAVLAADACSDAVALSPDRSVTLDAPEPVVVAGDQAHLRQAIANLVMNAVRHTPPGTPIEVVASLEDGGAVVQVRDHGPGLDAEALAHVFDRFWQADRARAGAGAGLGLSIVAGIAAEHGGAATAENANDGGAVFTVRLPVA